jgi:hypothetical protein
MLMRLPWIFVSVASYRDPELAPTIRDCIARADHPRRLRFGIAWQHGPEERWELPRRSRRFRVLDIEAGASRGVCWARAEIEKLWDGEEFTLQLDSHHRFVQGWDSLLAGMFRQCRAAGSEKPALTAYLPSFNPRNTIKRDMEPWQMNFDRFIPEGAVFFRPAAIPDWEKRTAPIPARFFSAHFRFAAGSFQRDVPYDPNYYFHGEEISMAARSFTHGYDLFHPHRLVAWHEYTREGRVKHWDDHVAENGLTPWAERNDASHRRNRVLFGMDGEAADIDFGPYGFGTERTLEDYERYAGLNFALRGVQEYTLQHLPPPNPQPYASREEWLASFVRPVRFTIRLEPAEVFHPDNNWGRDFDLWGVTAHDCEGREVYSCEMRLLEILRALDRRPIEREFQAEGKGAPVAWTLRMHSRSRGWGRTVTKPI